MPSFLRLPRRSEKPRFVGLTHVIDKGLPVGELESRLAAVGEYVDVWKLGFGTAYLDPTVEDKVAALERAGIRACLGGTLLEVAWAQGRAEECLDWAGETGFACVEVSNGTCAMPLEAKPPHHDRQSEVRGHLRGGIQGPLGAGVGLLVGRGNGR